MGGYRHARRAVAVTTSVSPVAYHEGDYEPGQTQQTHARDQDLLPPGYPHCTVKNKQTQTGCYIVNLLLNY